MMEDTLIVVITRQRLKFLKRCIESLMAADIGDAYVMVIDNGSTDGSVAYLSKFDRINEIIVNSADTPQWQKAYAIRQAWEIAKEKGMEYFCWIDDDMVLYPDFLKAGRQLLEANDDIHVACLHHDALQQRKHRTSSRFKMGKYEVHKKHTSNGPVWLVHRSFVEKYGLPPVKNRTDGEAMSDRYYDKRLKNCGKWIGVIAMSTHLGYKESLRMVLQGKRRKR